MRMVARTPGWDRVVVLGLAWALVVLTAMPAWAGYRLVDGPEPDDPMGVSTYELDNGLTVYLSRNPEQPQFYSEVVVRVGHKHDPPTNTGLAHYLEHLLFKGSRRMGTLDYEKERPHLEKIEALYEQRFHETDPQKRAEIYERINEQTQRTEPYVVPNELNNTYKALGAWGLNAHTWFEETVYKVGLPSNRLEQWAVIESDRFHQPVFRLFMQELEVVYEEKNRAMDNKNRAIFEAMIEKLFQVHPYGQQTTLGDVEHLKNPSLRAMREYYETYYVPNNMAIAISGDVDKAETIELIDEHFGRWERKSLPEPRGWEEPPLEDVVRVTIEFKGEPYVIIGYRTPGRNESDADALRVADMVMANSAAGLIDLNLVQKQRVRSAGASLFLFNDYGWEYLWAIPKDGQTHEEAEALLLEQVEKVKRGQFDESLLSGIVTNLKKDRSRSMESDPARVAMLRNAFLAGQDWDYARRSIERMEKLSKEEVVAAARRHFGDGYVVAYRKDGQQEVPKIEKPAIEPLEIDDTRRSAFAAEVLSMPAEPIEPQRIVPGEDYRELSYADGVPLMYAPNPLNDLFTLSFVFETGQRHDPALGLAAQLMDKSGAGERSAEQMSKKWFELATDRGIGVGDDRTSITLSGLDENFEQSLALLMTWLREPVADDQTLDDLVSNVKVQRADSKKNPGTVAFAIRQHALHGDESVFLRALPNEALDGLTVDELHRRIAELLSLKHEVRYTGSLSPETVMSVLRTHHRVDGPLADPPPYEPLRAHRPTRNEIRFYHDQTAQSRIYVDFADVRYDESLVPAVELYNEYFSGGMGGIVMQQLREARALAYSAGARYSLADRLDDENRMFAMIACQADKTVEALDALLGLIEELPRSDTRFGQVLESMDNRYRTARITFRGILGSVDQWRRLGLDGDPRPHRFDAIQRAQLDTIFDFHSRHVDDRPRLITVVGDRERIDLDALAEHGELIEVSLDELFSY